MAISPNMMAGLSLSELCIEDCMVAEQVSFGKTGSVASVLNILASAPNLKAFTWILDRNGRHAHALPAKRSNEIPGRAALLCLRRLVLHAPVETIAYIFSSVSLPLNCHLDLGTTINCETVNIALVKQSLRDTVGEQLYAAPRIAQFTQLSLRNAENESGILMHWSNAHDPPPGWSQDFRMAITPIQSLATDEPPLAISDICTCIMEWEPLRASITLLEIAVPWFYTRHANDGNQRDKMWAAAVQRLPQPVDVKDLVTA
ncbi:unnamed protein product [Peniophora sp. CBMAI 1063]|nr:unnamed protein product [Peniophora sp. CBMAI 1063]